MKWPGLNAPVTDGKMLVRQKELPPNKDRESKLIEIRNRIGRFRVFKMDSLERGWSGTKLPGRKLGPPDPQGAEKFEGFETIALEYKAVSIMDGKLGRKRRLSLFVVTGNGNGLAGFALAKGSTQTSCARLCKKMASQRLIYVDRCDDHTIYHNFYSQYLFTKIYAARKPEGYGLVCCRTIKEICKVIGIKNLYAKIDGSTNVQNVTKAFFLGLLKQKTHQQLADEKGLHVMKLRTNGLPRVMASPRNNIIRSNNDIKMDEELDYDIYTMDNKIYEYKKPSEPFYTKLPSYEFYLKKREHNRNRDKIKHQLAVEYGSVVSFLKEDYPECDRLFKVVEDDD